jgi:predicted nucleic acid-binding protein
MSLAFPDVNVWLALSAGHVHQKPALEWWNQEAREIGFCRFTSSSAHASPKIWADAYLLAFAEETGAIVVTFDRALARRREHSILLT